MSETKFAAFMTQKKLSSKRVLTASHKLETLHREDRQIKLAKRQAKSSEGGDAAKQELGKPRSGRAVTPRAIDSAIAGRPLSGPTKQRILRAVNHLLEQKKQEKVDLKTLF